MNLSAYSNAQLLTAFNAHTGRDIKKFENRQIAEARVGGLIRDAGLDIDAILAAGNHAGAGEATPPTQTIDESLIAKDDEVPAFLRREPVAAKIEEVAPLPKTEAEIERDAKIEEFFKMSETDGRAAFIAAIEYGKSLAPAGKTPRAKTERKAREPRSTGPNKREQAAALLTREGGATSREILDVTGWPAVSVPALAKASKLSLRQEKDGKVTRYFGTPIAA